MNEKRRKLATLIAYSILGKWKEAYAENQNLATVRYGSLIDRRSGMQRADKEPPNAQGLERLHLLVERLGWVST